MYPVERWKKIYAGLSLVYPAILALLAGEWAVWKLFANAGLTLAFVLAAIAGQDPEESILYTYRIRKGFPKRIALLGSIIRQFLYVYLFYFLLAGCGFALLSVLRLAAASLWWLGLVYLLFAAGIYGTLRFWIPDHTERLHQLFLQKQILAVQKKRAYTFRPTPQQKPPRKGTVQQTRKSAAAPKQTRKKAGKQAPAPAPLALPVQTQPAAQDITAQMQQFWAVASREFGLNPVLKDIFTGKTPYAKKAVPLEEWAQTTPPDLKKGEFAWWQFDCKAFKWHDTAAKVDKVKNSERIRRVDTDLRHSALCHGKTIPSARSNTDAPALETLLLDQKPKGDILAHLTGKQPVWAVGSLPGRAASAFFSQRALEMERLCQTRIAYYAQLCGRTRAGIQGEAAVRKLLELHAGALVALYGVRLAFEDEGRASGYTPSIETDVIVLSPTGIFALEVKNYGSRKFKITADGSWYELVGGERKPMDNPYRQNDRHIGYLERFLNQQLGRTMDNWIRVENIVVLANEKTQLDASPAALQKVTGLGNLYNHLTRNQTPQLTEQEIKFLQTRLHACDAGEKAYPYQSYTKELSHLVASYEQLCACSAQTHAAIGNCLAARPEFSGLRSNRPVEKFTSDS